MQHPQTQQAKRRKRASTSESAVAEATSKATSVIPGALRGALQRAVERVSERIGERQIPLLLNRRERVKRELREIPERMQKTTNQAALVLELIDDYRAGEYREVPWHSLAIAAAALVYSVSPSDVVPDFVPLLGQLDDALVIGVAMRVVQKDLQRYCRFKGYDASKYF